MQPAVFYLSTKQLSINQSITIITISIS